ncbi:MAG: glycosyltransferase [Chloroflexota bacterium]|nr:glycosyltransferase [Chloroflexota bacterium]
MHILHVTPYYAPAYAFGGVVRAVEGLAQALFRRGHRLTVLTTDAYDLSHPYEGALESDEQGIRVIRVRNLVYPFRRLNLSTPIAMRDRASQLLDDVDVVHLHELRTVEALLVAPLAHQRGIPIVLSPHGTLPISTGRGGLKQLWDQLLSPVVMHRVAAVVGLTDDETAQARTFAERTGDSSGRRSSASIHLATIPNGVDLAISGPVSGIKGTQLPVQNSEPGTEHHELRTTNYQLGVMNATTVTVLFLGRLHARKGVDILARAFMRANIPNSRLVIAGPDEGMLPALQALAAQDSRIELVGFLDGAARLHALAQADVFALPATGEGLSMALLEAMAAGIPLLISPGCHLPEAERAGAALIVPPEIEPLADALRVLMSDAERRQGMGEAARKLAEERFSWEGVAAQWEATYENLKSG